MIKITPASSSPLLLVVHVVLAEDTTFCRAGRPSVAVTAVAMSMSCQGELHHCTCT